MYKSNNSLKNSLNLIRIKSLKKFKLNNFFQTTQFFIIS